VYQNSLTPLGRYDKSNVPAGTTFIIAAGSAGEIGYCDKPFWAADDCYYLLPQIGVVSKYVYYALVATRHHISGLVRRGSVPRLARDIVECLEVQLPDESTQVGIVDAISAIDNLIIAQRSLISKFEAIKKATVNLLLKPKDNWHSIKLKEFESYKNNTCSRSLTTTNSGRIRNIHYGDILVKFNEIVSLKDCRIDCLTNEGELRSPADYIQDGDIIIADTAEDETAGKVVEMRDVGDNKAVAGLHTVFLRPPKMLFAHGWLGYWMNSRYYHDQLLPYMTGIKVLSLSKSSLSGTEVFYPPRSEQERIVSVFESIDSHISALRCQVEKMQKLKDGMMAYFFG